MRFIFSIVLERFLHAIVALIYALLFPTTLREFIRIIIRRLSGLASTDHRTVVISRASAGIGEELSYEYASAGYDLVLLSMDKDKLDHVVHACKDLGSGSVQAVIVDLCDRRAITELMDAKAREWSMDLFIANVNVTSDERSILECQDGAHEPNIYANFDTAIAGINAIFHSLVSQHRHGQIAISVSPEILQGSSCPLSFLQSYAVAQTASLAYGTLMRSIGRQYGIRFNNIAPYDILFAAIIGSNLAKYIVWVTSQKKFMRRIRKGLRYDLPIIMPTFWSHTLSDLCSYVSPVDKQVMILLLTSM